MNLTSNILLLLGICIILLILTFLKRKGKRSRVAKIKENMMKESIDMSNVINSSFNASRLYDELKKARHPDRFIDENIKEKANILFQQVTQHKRDYKKLLGLQERINEELNMK